jgi:hypothetical protein
MIIWTNFLGKNSTTWQECRVEQNHILYDQEKKEIKKEPGSLEERHAPNDLKTCH